MEFKKGCKVISPFWLYVIELSKFTNSYTHALIALKIVTEIWKDRLVKGTYTTLIKNIKDNLITNETAYYEVGITLNQLKHDPDVAEGLTKLKDIIKEYFTEQ